MADPTKPPSIPVDDNWTVWAVPGGVANPAAPSIATDINKVATVDITCYLTHKRVGTSASQATYDDPRLCSSRISQKQGAVTETAEPLEYINDPQAALNAAMNAAQNVLVQNTRVDLVIRKGVAYGTTPTAGQFVEVLVGRPGVANDISEPTGGVFKLSQAYSLDDHKPKVALVA